MLAGDVLYRTISVADLYPNPDPTDSYVFALPGSVSGSISQRGMDPDPLVRGMDPDPDFSIIRRK